MKELYKFAQSKIALTMAQRQIRYAALELLSAVWLSECEAGANWEEVGERLLGIDLSQYRDEYPNASVQELNNVLCRLENDLLMDAANRVMTKGNIAANDEGSVQPWGS